MFDQYLDEICNNTVGNTILRLLIANIRTRTPTRKINLRNDLKSDGSFYRSSESLVSVNFSYYDDKGIGIPDRDYYGVSNDNTIQIKGKTLVGSLFHELTHALHDVEGSKNCTKLDDYWGNTEERRTISGHINETTFDPICDNCFDLYKSLKNHSPFCPRIGHCGSKEDKEKLSAWYREQKFDLAWCKKYIIE
jgi:hypothetical protein